MDRIEERGPADAEAGLYTTPLQPAQRCVCAATVPQRDRAFPAEGTHGQDMPQVHTR